MTLSAEEVEYGGFVIDGAPDEVRDNKVWLAIYEMAVGHEIDHIERKAKLARLLADGSVERYSATYDVMNEYQGKAAEKAHELATVLTMLQKDKPIGYICCDEMMSGIHADAKRTIKEEK